MRTDFLYLSLGSNQGAREQHICDALALLEKKFGVPCRACSAMLETRPWGNWGENPIAQEYACTSRPCVENFINVAACFELSQSAFTPHQILAICKQVESEFGRVEKIEYDVNGERVYHSRPIDIDILLWGDLLLDTSDLTIPHPLMWERDFVLTPLAEIADETLKLKIINNKKL